MYTQEDLVEAIRSGDFATISAISAHFASLAGAAEAALSVATVSDASGEGPAKPKAARVAKPKADKSKRAKAGTARRKKADPDLPVPDEDGSWIAPSFSDEGRTSGRTVFEPVSRVDPSKIRWVTGADDDDEIPMTREQKKAEAAKRKSRGPGVNRPAAVKRKTPCEGCRREFDVYPSQMTGSIADSDGGDKGGKVDFFYLCPRCVKKPR